MEVQPQLVLLQKTLLQIEGLGRQLYPELDLWKTAKPVLEDWMRERRDPRTQLKKLIEAWPEISEDLSLLPGMLHRAIRRAETGDANEQRALVRGSSNPSGPRAPRLERTIAGAALVIAGVIWSGLSEPQWIGWVASAIGLVLLVLGRRGA
jgi:ubiquinone biosynthesis protein